MIDPATRRWATRRRVFELVHRHRRISRAQLGRESGVSFPTVMKVVDEFLEKGLLIELDEMEPMTGAGRRGHLLEFVPGAYRAVGVECEGRYAHAGVVDMYGAVLARETIELGDLRCARELSLLNAAIERMIHETGEAEVLGVCMGIPGNVNPEAGQIVCAETLGISEPTPFREAFPAFCEALQAPVFVENDANIACEGEAHMRMRDGCGNDMLCLSLGTGFGGALRMNGRLQRGARFRLGEIGQTLLCPDRGLADAKRETLESVVALSALEERFGVTIRQGESLPPDVAAAMRDYLRPLLGGVIYNGVTMLDLDLCVLSGIVPGMLGTELHRQLTRDLQAALPWTSAVRVEPPVCADTGIIGAAAMVFKRRLEDIL